MNYLVTKVDFTLSFHFRKVNDMTTFNGGSLGSCIDEERSELRYVM